MNVGVTRRGVVAFAAATAIQLAVSPSAPVRAQTALKLPLDGRADISSAPLFLALVMIEIADVIFAVDSVPAIFAITTDPYIVYTSNMFAILGLRAWYGVLARAAQELEYLETAVAVVLGRSSGGMQATRTGCASARGRSERASGLIKFERYCNELWRVADD